MHGPPATSAAWTTQTPTWTAYGNGVGTTGEKQQLKICSKKALRFTTGKSIGPTGHESFAHIVDSDLSGGASAKLVRYRVTASKKDWR